MSEFPPLTTVKNTCANHCHKPYLLAAKRIAIDGNWVAKMLVISQSGGTLTILGRRYACNSFEEFTKEKLIAEVKFLRYLRYR